MSRYLPDPKNWIHPRTFAQNQSLATPPPSTSRRRPSSGIAILPNAGPSSSVGRQKQSTLMFVPTPPDSRLRLGADGTRRDDEASPSLGHRQRAGQAQRYGGAARKKVNSTLSTAHVFLDEDVEDEDENEDETEALVSQKMAPSQRRRTTLAPKDPNIQSTSRATASSSAKHQTKPTLDRDFSSDPDYDLDRSITPSRARALQECADMVLGKASDRSQWNARAPWVQNPLPSPGVRRPAPAPAPAALKRKRATSPVPTQRPGKKITRTTSLLERSIDESIDTEELVNFNFARDVMVRVEKNKIIAKPVRGLERYKTSPAVLGSSSSLTPLPSSDPPESEAEMEPEPQLKPEPMLESEPEAERQLSPGRTPSPILATRTRSSPRQLQEFQETLFSQYLEPAPPPPPSPSPPRRSRRDFIPAQIDPETLMTWSADSSSDSAAPVSDAAAVQVVGTLDRWLEDEADVTRVNADSLAFAQRLEMEMESGADVAPGTSMDLDRPVTPSRHVKFAPTPLAPTPIARLDSASILVPDSQESYHPTDKLSYASQTPNDFVPETMFPGTAPFAASSSPPVSSTAATVVASSSPPAGSSPPARLDAGESIVPSSQTQAPLFRGLDPALMLGETTPRASAMQATPRANKGKSKSKDDGKQPTLSAFGYFAKERERRVRDFDVEFEDEPELSEDEMEGDGGDEVVISSQTQAPLLPVAPMHPDLRPAGRRELLRKQAEARARREVEIREQEHSKSKKDEMDLDWDVDEDYGAAVPSSQASNEDRLSCLDGLSSLSSEPSQKMESLYDDWINGVITRAEGDGE